MKFVTLLLIFYLSMAKGMVTEIKLKEASMTSDKIKSLNLHLRGIDYFAYDYDYGYYGTSYRCHPYDYECNNYGYDFGGYHK